MARDEQEDDRHVDDELARMKAALAHEPVSPRLRRLAGELSAALARNRPSDAEE